MADVIAGDIVWRIKGDLTAVNQSMKDARTHVEQNFGMLANTVGSVFVAAGAAVVGGLSLATKEAADFGRSMGQIATLGVKDLGGLEKGIMDVATAYGQDLNVAAEGAYQVISSTGLKGAEAMDFLGVAAKSAAAGQVDLSDAVLLGAGTANAFGMEYTQVGDIFDDVWTAVEMGVTTFGELSSSVGKLSPSFSAAGLSVQDMLATVTALTKGGMATTEAVTYTNAAINAIIKPTSDATKTFEELKKGNDAVTISFDAASLEAVGLKEFLDQVAIATGGDVAQMAKLFTSTEGLKAVLALTGAQSESFAEILDTMGTNMGRTDQAFKAFEEANPAFAFDQMKAALQVLAVEVGQALLPVLKDLARWVTEHVKALAGWIREHEELAGAIIKAVGIFGVAALAFGVLQKASLPLIATWKALAFVSTALAGAGGLGGVTTAATTAAGAVGTVGTAAGTAAGASGLGALLVGAAATTGLLAAIAAAATLTGLALWQIGVQSKGLIDDYDALHASEEALKQKTDEYTESLRAKGVAIDENKLASMDHAETMAYLAEQEKADIETLALAHFETMSGREATEQEYAQLKNMLLSKNLSAEEAATVTLSTLTDERKRDMMTATREEANFWLKALGLKEEGALRGDASITKSALDSSKARRDEYQAEMFSMQEATAETTSYIGAAFQRMWDWVSGYCAQAIRGIQAAWNGVAGMLGFETGGVIPGFAMGGAIQALADGGTAEHRIVMVGERGPEPVALPIGSRVMSHSDMMQAVSQGSQGGGGDTNVQYWTDMSTQVGSGLERLKEQYQQFAGEVSELMAQLRQDVAYALNPGQVGSPSLNDEIAAGFTGTASTIGAALSSLGGMFSRHRAAASAAQADELEQQTDALYANLADQGHQLKVHGDASVRQAQVQAEEEKALKEKYAAADIALLEENKDADIEALEEAFNAAQKSLGARALDEKAFYKIKQGLAKNDLDTNVQYWTDMSTQVGSGLERLKEQYQQFAGEVSELMAQLRQDVAYALNPGQVGSPSLNDEIAAGFTGTASTIGAALSSLGGMFSGHRAAASAAMTTAMPISNTSISSSSVSNTTNSTPITVNVNNPTVRNDGDIQAIASAVKDTLMGEVARTLQGRGRSLAYG